MSREVEEKAVVLQGVQRVGQATATGIGSGARIGSGTSQLAGVVGSGQPPGDTNTATKG